MYKTFKTRIYPNDIQKEEFVEAFGIRRWIWNWCIDEFFSNLDVGVYLSRFDLIKKINVLVNNGYEWIARCNSMIRQEVIKDFTISLSKYMNKSKTYTYCRPRYRKKKDQNNTFRIHMKTKISILTKGKILDFNWTRKFGRMSIKMAEKFSHNDIKELDIIEENGKYYAILTYKIANCNNIDLNNNKSIGIDMGIKNPLYSIDSEGMISITKVPNKIKLLENNISKLCTKLSNKVYDSKNYRKQLSHIKKKYTKIRNIIKDIREKTSTYIVSNYKNISIEYFDYKSNINVSDVNKARYRFGSFEFLKRLEEKCSIYGNNLIKVPRGVPTTQTCNVCGNIKVKEDKLKMGDRVYSCSICGHEEDRDLNAAKNILKYVTK